MGALATAASTAFSPFSALAGSITPLPPVTGADGRLGLCDVLAGAIPGTAGRAWAQAAHDAGARVNRWEFRWDRLQRQPNVWDFSHDDPVVHSSVASGLDVLGILIGTPGWAVAAGQKPGNGVPAGLHLPFTDARNVWAGYVRRTVTHYGGLVKYWEVWNEPDLSFFWGGSSEAYFRLLKVAYRTIHQVEPSATVLVAGMVVPDTAFLQRVLADSAADPDSANNHGFFDAVSWHQYGSAAALYPSLMRIRSILSGFNEAATPIWVTEDGFPSSNPNGEARQAAYVEQTVAYAFAAGVARLLVYRASDDRPPKLWGLMSASGVPRMGYLAFQVAASEFAAVPSVIYAPTPSVERFVLYKPGLRTLMVWTKGLAATSVTMTAQPSPVTEMDWQGAVSASPIVNGRLRVMLPGASYNSGVDPSGSVVGGPPVFLQQPNVAPVLLPATAYLRPLAGSMRRLEMLNDGTTPLTFDVSAYLIPAAHSVMVLPAHSAQMIDLDLIAGVAYQGAYRLSAPASLPALASSDAGLQPLVSPSTRWYMPAGPHSLTLVNIAKKPLTVRVLGYGIHGVRRVDDSVRLPARGQATWSVPDRLATARLALVIHAKREFVVTGGDGGPSVAFPSASQTWYAVRPAAHNLTVFNPNAKDSMPVTVRFFGSRSFQSEQLMIAAHQSAVVNGHASRVAALTSNQPFSVGYLRPSGALPQLAGRPAAHVALATDKSTVVRLFNPSDRRAHVAIAWLSARGSTRLPAVSLSPGQDTSVRSPNGHSGAQGVVFDSDMPIVAVPSESSEVQRSPVPTP
ncbi:MAG: hypothetical protein ACR2JC_07900 [Chloroflexota bacterium]